jgi:hypothetical protein
VTSTAVIGRDEELGALRAFLAGVVYRKLGIRSRATLASRLAASDELART